MLGRADQGFVDISAMALNVAIKGSILADPEACLVMKMAFPFGSTRARASGRELIEAEYRSLIISGVFSVRSIGQEAAKVIGDVAAIGNEATTWPDLLQQGPCVHLDLPGKRRAPRR